MQNFIINCPHCQDQVLIEKINCGIFRHGVIKSTGKRVPPHASKERCNTLKAQDLIYGCGKPFQIKKSDPLNPTICDYI